MAEPSTRPNADDNPTVADTPAAVSARSVAMPASSRPSETPVSDAGSRVTSVVTPRDTLHLQEVARTRAFVVVTGFFAVLVAITLTVVGGDPTAKRVLWAGLAGVFAACATLGWVIRRDEGYTIGRAMVAAYVCICGAFTGIWYFGVYSPAAMILPFGLSFFSIGQSGRGVFAVYATCAVVQLVLMVLVATGAVADQGLIRGSALTVLEQIVVIVLVQATLLATFLVQRRTRAATIFAIEQHDKVVRSLAQRDALLHEARQDLADVLKAGGLGRWTDEVVGGFRLGRVMGRGAMGEVYEATRTSTGEPAAVKLLHPHVLEQSELVQRFTREARIVASLAVPNVVRVLDVSPPDARVPYIVMERLIGHDLADYLREHKRMGVRAVLTMLRQVGAGLDAARGAGVVHRDLKPRNVFLAREGMHETWKILDFGVARLAGEETLTRDQIVGTPNYMAPEQATGEKVTHKTDLFALGIIAYRALTGRPAFEGETTPEILYKVVRSMPPRPGEIASLPQEIEWVLAVALAKDPEDRFDSGGQLAQALDAASRGKIDAALRGKAERLLAKIPWGQTT
jgi:tRNA A-37 threonylcarbamoyl transferase component Bud32